MYALLDVLLLVAHTVLVIFNLTGWVWRKTRRAHLVVISLTMASWFGLGIAYGWGYCPLTDWHWDVKRALGEQNLPASYVKYYVDQLTGGDVDGRTVDYIVAALGIGAFVASVVLNVRDARARAGRTTSDGP